MPAQHSTMAPEKWAAFPLDRQILMIGNEMNRAASLFGPQDRERLGNCYERVLNLVDLTVEVNDRPGLRREMLRWRDLVAQLYVASEAREDDHRAAFRCLLLLTPSSAKQIPHLAALRAATDPAAARAGEPRANR